VHTSDRLLVFDPVHRPIDVRRQDSTMNEKYGFQKAATVVLDENVNML